MSNDKTVMRFNDGSTLKGYLDDFLPKASTVSLREVGTSKVHPINIEEIKAIFFVRSFEGDHTYNEKKTYGISKPRGQRVYIKFRDGESLVGFLEGDVPWERGFFLSKRDKDLKGFYLWPVDGDTNNIKVIVVASSVIDVTVVPGP